MWGFFIAFTLPVIVRKICLIDNLEKLSTLLGFWGDIGRVGEGLLQARISSQSNKLLFSQSLKYRVPVMILYPVHFYS